MVKSYKENTTTLQGLRCINITGVTLAGILGMTPQAVSNAHQAGRIPRRADGTYNLVDAVQAYAADLRQAQARRTADETDARAEYDYWRTELTKTKVASWVEAHDLDLARQLLDGLAPILRQFGELLQKATPEEYSEGLAILKKLEDAGLPGITPPPEEDDGE
jgi:hypothetical protein